MDEGIRPWGFYEVLVEQNDFKVKKITVNPCSKLSYQSHSQRQEVWTVLSGEGVVTIDGYELNVKYEDVIIILPQQKHRIANYSAKQLVFIEVQTGPYLGEDDIIRYDDDYGRQTVNNKQ